MDEKYIYISDYMSVMIWAPSREEADKTLNVGVSCPSDFSFDRRLK